MKKGIVLSKELTSLSHQSPRALVLGESFVVEKAESKDFRFRAKNRQRRYVTLNTFLVM